MALAPAPAPTPPPPPAPPFRHLWAWVVAFGVMNALAFRLGWPFVVIP